MVDALTEAVGQKSQTIFGYLCGYALLADEGHEGGNITQGLGWISGKVRHFSDCLIDPESRNENSAYGMEQPFYNPR